MCPVLLGVDATAQTDFDYGWGGDGRSCGGVLAGVYTFGRGSGRHASSVGPEARIPAAECRFPLVIQDARADLQQEMGAAFGPLHLLFFHHALAHDLIDRGFDKARLMRSPW